MRFGVRAATAVLWVASAVAVACGGSTSTAGSGGAPAAGTGGTSGASGTSGTGGGGTGGSGGSPAPGPCSSSKTGTACKKCCDTKEPGGSDRLLQLIAACICKPSVCATACKATVCASPPNGFDAQCSACESAASNGTASACLASVSTKCDADATCHAYTACIADSGCLDKP